MVIVSWWPVWFGLRSVALNHFFELLPRSSFFLFLFKYFGVTKRCPISLVCVCGGLTNVDDHRFHNDVFTMWGISAFPERVATLSQACLLGACP